MILSVVVSFSVILSTLGHLCLIDPRQRGDMNIIFGGSKTCARHEPQCGGLPAEPPSAAYTGGKQMWIKWQQNYNHYDVGYPGYMDIAIAPINSTSWQTIGYVADEYFYSQDHQQNYTALVVLPNIDCNHCVLRARYQSHKPGESIFYQCADISITRSSELYKSLRKIPQPEKKLDLQYQSLMKKFGVLKRKHGVGKELKKLKYIDQHCLIGFSYDTTYPGDGWLTSVNVNTGEQRQMEEFYINIALRHSQNKKYRFSESHGAFVYNAISAINLNGNLIQLYHQGQTADLINDYVMEVDLKHPGDIIKRAKIIDGPDGPISAVIPYAEDCYYTISMVDRNARGQYSFVLGQLTYTANQQFTHRALIWSELETLYVNFQWAEYDSERNRVYVLMGNENSPDRLQARIYTYDLKKKNVTWVEIDVSDYTFMSIQLHKKTGRLFAVSPGLFYHFNPYWSLIEVNPATGKSEKVMDIADGGYFARYYGGTIFNGIDQETDMLYHVFRLIDTNADVIVGINLITFKLTFSELTNLRHLYNLSYIRANNTCYI